MKQRSDEVTKWLKYANAPLAVLCLGEYRLYAGHTVGGGVAWQDPERRITMRDYEIVDTDADNIGGCAICRYKSDKNEGRRRKLDWLRKHYAEGVRLKVLRSREFGDIGMIEYVPGDQAWRPVAADGYMMIHCLMVHSEHTGKGLGTLLLKSCLKDARKSKCRGVAVVTSSDNFMPRSDLFMKAGFVVADRIPPYELLVRKFRKTAPGPRFIVDRRWEPRKHPRGLTILAADQCPMVARCVKDIAEASRAMRLKAKVVHIHSARRSRALPTPYGIFSIIYDGLLIADRPISVTRFRNIMRKLV